MTTRDFCYWFQGFLEITGANEIKADQVEMIQRHLNLVFVHDIDPTMGDEEHQALLNAIHNTIAVNTPKPTLQELGEKYNFQVADGRHGPCPHPGWKLSSIHGWYDPKDGPPRC